MIIVLISTIFGMISFQMMKHNILIGDDNSKNYRKCMHAKTQFCKGRIEEDTFIAL
jgi:hypothetical protein